MLTGQTKLLCCAAIVFALLSKQACAASDIQGTWAGALDLGILGEARITLAVQGDTASITSIDNHWRDVSATIKEHTGDIDLDAGSIKVIFQGNLSGNGQQMAGTWIQGSRVRPLVFHRQIAGKILTPEIPSRSVPHPQALTDGEVQNILRQRVTEKQSVGVVVGIIDARGRRVITFGSSGASEVGALSGKTLFEIGSISKVFTSLLLQLAVNRNEVRLNDPVSSLAPSGAHIPEWGGHSIKLVDLSTHTSGLPDDGNLWDKDSVEPYSHYDVAQLFRSIGQLSLSDDPGTTYVYSNYNAALLGQVLALRAGKSYGQLVHDQITGPLGMDATGLDASGPYRAIGHDAALKPVPPFDAQAFGPAGGLRSNADDMMSFLGAELGFVKTSLSPAMQAQWKSLRRPAINPQVQAALGWVITLKPEATIVWHNGGTPGFRSFAGFNPKAGIGVVVLSNTFGGQLETDDIGLHLLDPSAPLDVIAPPRK